MRDTLSQTVKEKESVLIQAKEEKKKMEAIVEDALRGTEETKKKMEEAEKDGKKKRDEITRLELENEALKASVKRQEIRIQELEKNKLTNSQLERVKMIVEEKKGLKKKLKEKEAIIAKLTQHLASLKKGERDALPRNTKPKEDGDETIELVKEANRMKDRLQGIAAASVELPKNVAPELRSTVPSSSKKRPAVSDPAVSRKRVEEDQENDKSCQTQ